LYLSSILSKFIIFYHLYEQTWEPHVQEVWSSNPWMVKSCTALHMVYHSFNI